MGGGELAPPPSYKEIFHAVFPYYLSIGMTHSQFWNEDACLVKDYRKADELRTKRKNAEFWLQGMYTYEALCNVSPVLHAFAKGGTEPIPYPAKPYAITQEERRERETARLKEQAEGFRALVEAKNFEREQEAQNGRQS